MKTATTALVNFLNSKKQFICADLFTLELKNGDKFYFTNVDVVVTWLCIPYSPYGLMFDGLRYKIEIGLEADEQTINILADPSFTLSGVPFVTAVQGGALDQARITRDRAYFESWDDLVLTNPTDPAGVINLFSGYVSTITGVTRLGTELRVKSDLAKLDIEMPRNRYQAACLHNLYDNGCKVIKASYEATGAVEAGSTALVINNVSATVDYYSRGTMEMTSGLCSGETRSIKQSTGTQYIMANPFSTAPATGDTFKVYPGCDKTLATCGSKFSNVLNNRSFPFIPTAEVAF